MKKSLLLASLALLLLSAGGKDKKAFEGMINYTFDYHLKPGEIRLPEGFLLYIKGTHMRVDIEAPFGSVRTLIDANSDDIVKLYVVAGGKYIERLKRSKVKAAKEVFVSYKDSLSTLKGYNCRKALLTDSTGTRAIWYGETLKIAPGFSKFSPGLCYNAISPNPGLQGKLILNSESGNKLERVSMFANKLDEKILEESVFTFNEKEYQETTAEEIGKIIRESFR